jgi:hypothetical protein
MVQGVNVRVTWKQVFPAITDLQKDMQHSRSPMLSYIVGCDPGNASNVGSPLANWWLVIKLLAWNVDLH